MFDAILLLLQCVAIRPNRIVVGYRYDKVMYCWRWLYRPLAADHRCYRRHRARNHCDTDLDSFLIQVNLDDLLRGLLSPRDKVNNTETLWHPDFNWVGVGGAARNPHIHNILRRILNTDFSLSFFYVNFLFFSLSASLLLFFFPIESTRGYGNTTLLCDHYDSWVIALEQFELAKEMKCKIKKNLTKQKKICTTKTTLDLQWGWTASTCTCSGYSFLLLEAASDDYDEYDEMRN